MNNTRKILDELENKGYESYLVGGFIRDELLGKETYDIDITTTARPEDILRVFKDYKCIDIGKKFGTIKVLYENMEYEITTMRKESAYTDKRHPSDLVFTDDINEDLKRRDFTINAMANRYDKIIDPYGGRDDLNKQIIRALGDPFDRISEDMLRSLRAVRFATNLDFRIDEDLKEAIRANSKYLMDISKERIQVEINKILLAENPVRGIRLLDELGMLKVIFPELYQTKGFDQHSSFHKDDLYTHSLSVLGKTPRILEVRMAALYHDVGKVDTFFLDESGEGRFFGHQGLSEKLLIDRLKHLKYPKKFISDTSQLVKRHMDNTNTYTKKSVRKLLRNLGEDNLIKLFALQRADVLSTKHADDSNIDLGLRILRDVKADKIPNKLSELAISGKDLLDLGYKEGKGLGDRLREIENLVYDEKLTNNKEDIINYLKETYDSVD